MIDNIPQSDDNTEDTPEWALIEQVQNFLKKRLRQHDAGKDIQPSAVLAELHTLLEEKPADVQPQERLDIASGDIDYWGHIATRKESLSTGLSKLNEILGGGLEPQRLVVLLGAPGGGKTTLANQIAVHVADTGRPVLYVTSEDMPFTLLAKTLARQGKINYSAVLKGREEERGAIDQALQAYKMSKSAQCLRYVDATLRMDIETVRSCAQAHFEAHKEAGQGIIIVDYLQRLARSSFAYRNGNGDLRQAVTVLAEQLKALASELDCCVIALASQNRASGYGAGSNALSSAKESGDIEYTADVLMSIGDDDERMPVTSWLQSKILKLDKNRQGATGTIALDWYAERQQFTVAAVGQEESVQAASGRKRVR